MTNVINEKTGKPVDLSYLEKDLPKEIAENIELIKQNLNTGRLDLYLSDLYAELNVSLQDSEISKEQADYIRKKYLINKGK